MEGVVTHTYIHAEFGQYGSSIRVTLNTKPASQVLISATLGGAGGTGSPRYGIRDDSTSLVSLSCEIL